MKRIIIISLCVLSAVFSSRAADTDNIPVDTSDYAAFARTYGIVRYYSPNPYTLDWSEEDWFIVCFHLVNRLSETGDLQQVMDDMVVLAPNATLTAEPQAGQRSLTGPAEAYCYKEHTGGGKIEIQGIVRLLYKEYRDYNPFYITLRACDDTPDTPQAGMVYAYPVGDGLYLNLPHAERREVFSKKETDRLLKTAKKEWNTLLRGYGGLHKRAIGITRNADFRLADMITRWNIIQHFYPYKETDVPDWNEALPDMLVAMRDITHEGKSVGRYLLEYRDTILEQLNPVHDSHLFMTWDFHIMNLASGFVTYYYPAIRLNLVDNRILVEAVSPECETDITRHCIIERVNGKDAMELLQAQTKRVNSSHRNDALYSALPCIISADSTNAPIVLQYRDLQGNSGEDTLFTVSYYPYAGKPKEEPLISYTDDGIAIVRPCQRSAEYKDFAAALDTLRTMRGIVFDLRGYPMLDFDKVLSHLTDEPLPTSFISTPVTCFPNREKVRYVQSNEFLEPVAPCLNVPVVFLSDYHAMSWAETVLILVKGYELGTIVGSESCGTNGDATQYRLPVFPFHLTANYVTNVDGSRHHGVGVLPDIYIEPTLEGYLTGRDEVLERGIEYLRNKTMP